MKERPVIGDAEAAGETRSLHSFAPQRKERS